MSRPVKKQRTNQSEGMLFAGALEPLSPEEGVGVYNPVPPLSGATPNALATPTGLPSSSPPSSSSASPSPSSSSALPSSPSPTSAATSALPVTVVPSPASGPLSSPSSSSSLSSPSSSSSSLSGPPSTSSPSSSSPSSSSPSSSSTTTSGPLPPSSSSSSSGHGQMTTTLPSGVAAGDPTHDLVTPALGMALLQQSAPAPPPPTTTAHPGYLPATAETGAAASKAPEGTAHPSSSSSSSSSSGSGSGASSAGPYTSPGHEHGNFALVPTGSGSPPADRSSGVGLSSFPLQNPLIPVPAGQRYVDITDYLNMPQTKAAEKLGLPTSTLSKRWKEAVCNRKWPYRAVQKLDKEITTLLYNVPTGPDAPPLPKEIEEALGRLLRKRDEELRSVVVRI